jgi:glucose/arabinose dehydrogenase
MLITERAGRLRVVRDGVLDPQAISGLPEIRTDGNGGLMDVALHPGFEQSRLVYFTYTKPVGNGMGAPALARGRLEDHALVDNTSAWAERLRHRRAERRTMSAENGPVSAGMPAE